MEPDKETRIEILLQELDRMREATAAARAARVRLMNGGGLVMLALLLFAYTPWLPMAALALPFVAIFIVMQYSFLTSSVVYARAQAAGLEARINAETGETVVAQEMLADRFYGPVGRFHFLGISPASLSGMLSATTIHFLAICAIFFIAGWLRTNYVLNSDLRPVDTLGNIYSPVLLLWTAANVAYLAWYHVLGEPEKNLVAGVRKDYMKLE